MFKNRSIQVSFNKNNPNLEDSSSDTQVDYAQIVRDTTETVAKKIILGVGVYVAVDTLRQVIVKLTPQN